MNSSGHQVPNMLLENNGEIAPEGMKRLSQSGNNAHADVSGGEHKVRCCKNNIA